MKEAGLPFGALTQGVRSEIDLVSLIVEPEDLMTVVLEPKIVKTIGTGTKKFKHLTLCKQWSQIHDTGKAVFQDNLDDTEYDRFRTMHGYYVSHFSSPASAALLPQTRHSSTPINVGRPKLAHG
jgi:hypothetical protein